MYTINLQILLVTFTIKVVTHRTRKIILHYRLQELKGHLVKRKHLEKINDYSFIKSFQPRKHESNDKNVIIFTRTYSPNHQFSFNKFNNCIKNTTNRELQKAFNDKKNTPYYTTTKEIKKFVSKSKI